jgi:hypothetical protein
MSEENQNQSLDPQIPKKRGAPYGNQNAYKHGFYSQHFTRAEMDDLSEMEPLELDDEIELIRTLMRRVLESSTDNTSHADNIDTLRSICMGNITLTRLIRTHYLKPKENNHSLPKELIEILAELDVQRNEEIRNLSITGRIEE